MGISKAHFYKFNKRTLIMLDYKRKIMELKIKIIIL